MAGAGESTRVVKIAMITVLALVAAGLSGGGVARGAEPDVGIYVMNADGSARTRLTDTLSLAIDWSPDGAHLAFSSDRDPNSEIHVMNADGTDRRQLTDGPGVDGAPAWSPDGTRLAFETDRDGNFDLYVMKADGSDPTSLTDELSNERSPAWSPDGSRVAFWSDREGNRDIYLIGADGSGLIRVTTDPADDVDPAWSPDGTRLAFQRYAPNGRTSKLYLVNTDGSGETALPESGYRGHAESPDWSHDGTRLAYTDGGSEGGVIAVINADGSGRADLTTECCGDASPAWSPQGTKVAFTRLPHTW